MRFSVRNTFYLKISKYDVLPLYLYLDERHVDWMSERTLQYVISDLQPLVGTKLEMERGLLYGSGTKKGSVDVHRGETYQFAYFLRKTVPHAVVMKTRNYVMVNKPRGSKAQATETAGKKAGKIPRPNAKRAQTSRTPRSSKKGKGKGEAIEVVSDSEPEAIDSSESDGDLINEEVANETRGRLPRSTRSKKASASYNDGTDEQDAVEAVEVKEEEAESALDLTGGPEGDQMQIDTLMDEDEDETKLKPKIQLSFRTLEMRDLCLCVVVEPWPAESATNAGGQSRSAVIATPRALQQATLSPPDHIPSVGRQRAETPLFLPDFDRGRSQTPASVAAPERFPSVFNGLESLDDQEMTDDIVDEHGMMAFSQALNKVSGDRMGVAGEDEDEMDGGALYGDADEMHDFSL